MDPGKQFGSALPWAEPAWYSGRPSPYYNKSHFKLRDAVRKWTEETVGAPPIRQFASKWLQKKILPEILSGQKRICLAVTEPSCGSDTAVRTGGPGADGISFLLIPRTEGIRTRKIEIGADGLSATTYIIFEDVKVPVEYLIGSEGQGFRYVMSNFNHERLWIAFQALRNARTCLQDAMAWAMKREAFDMKLIDQPVVRYKFGSMAKEVEALQAWTEQIVYELDHMSYQDGNRQLGGVTALLKVKGGQMNKFVADNCVQIMGGLGLTKTGQGSRIEAISRSTHSLIVPGGSEDVLIDLGVREALKLSAAKKRWFETHQYQISLGKTTINIASSIPSNKDSKVCGEGTKLRPTYYDSFIRQTTLPLNVALQTSFNAAPYLVELLHDRVLPFDRVFGDPSLPPLILYADVESPLFGGFHHQLMQQARDGQFSYRVRYRPASSATSRPLFVNGYGVELALKRTDYIVIDDRDAEQRVLKDTDTTNPTLAPAEDLENEQPADLKPLSASEVSTLGMNAASFIMSSDDPFATLLRLSQDFPRHSSAIAGASRTSEFTQEFEQNKDNHLQTGRNVIWVNGLQMEAQTVDAFSLLDHLRRERKLINDLRKFGLSARQAVDLLTNPTISKSLGTDDSIRYDYRDDLEGGGVIVWLNDLEKDHRYEGWPRDLHSSLSADKIGSPDQASFTAALGNHELRKDRTPLTFEDVLRSDNYDPIVSNTKSYLKRLAVKGDILPFFVNGATLMREGNFLQNMITALSKDLEHLQRRVYEGAFEEDIWIPSHFLQEALQNRSPLLIPENPSEIQITDLNEIYANHLNVFDTILRIPASVESDDPLLDWNSIILIADLDSGAGAELLSSLLELHKKHPGVEILLLHNGESPSTPEALSTRLYSIRKGRDLDPAVVTAALASRNDDSASDSAAASAYWNTVQFLVKEIGFGTREIGMVVNSRILGPLPSSTILDTEDLENLLMYEHSKRIGVLARVASEMDLDSNILDSLSLSRMQAILSLSVTSGISESIYNYGPSARTRVFEKWSGIHTAISVSNSDDPSINIVATIDPTTEEAQRWVPILKVLSELGGVSLKLFLNPREEIKELPIKRFYRHVLDVAPSFNEDGSLAKPQAVFHGIPGEALLNLGMDVPPAWLVAPKESIHDLDNLKLSTLRAGTNVDAIYELEHILIEGHSRDITQGGPPRGVQLLLGTEKSPHFADTIIMANLGYFQFKAQPGCWKITLKPGQSERIFHIDSVGGLGSKPTPGDESNDVALLSFQGKTLFPRISRKPGYENEDVLDEVNKPATAAKDFLAKGLNFASEILHRLAGPAQGTHADINIFSVASGHLYERMLNIMMVSVMKHTKHSVKFWFIEQFLSPSFKSFLPHLAAEYGFSYEMVTYKWPHWLRAQTEKQRIIWGYKILFLDVLFPLSLDKVIFVDADQIVRTDMYELVTLDLEGAPYGFTPMCDSRTSMEGFRFWKQGYWKNFLRGLPYHISALYVVDLKRFRAIAAGDRLRGQYHTLSADPQSLSNLDQDLPNNMQRMLPIKSLPQDWLWCETWCSDESLATAKTIDLCNNPLTKEPKLDRARRQVHEWTVYDEEIAAVQRRVLEEEKERMGAVIEGVDEEVPRNEGGDHGDGKNKKHKKDEL
ncbi:UDP-glucose:glycoprotein glucosyltransferase [Histoplasma capsulatum var. duboisii H88]|uniref:UDP-glucose:glycoprotein glucosyltransferase n=1 Tax=Ajellomyces capsulatus (strain H88) TaxID=544711 RepID=F0U6X7_AJEC8|nr:UDP-glucose:glycoprotein glucosyltransferase [Histoplasma capsulatum var. duboisii H88]